MVSSSNQQRRARSKEAKERRNESATATAKLATDIEAEVDGDADESITPPSTRDTPPPSDFDNIEEDSINVAKSNNLSPTVKPVEDTSDRSTDDNLDTGK